MAVVETDVQDQTMLIRLNRPERMNALGFELRTLMAEAWIKFEESKDLEVAIITGTGKGFCAGEDMKEALERGAPGSQSKPVADPLKEGKVTKPVIAAVNGFAMGGGFMLVERTDLRVSVPSAMFEVSEAKRWLLGGCNHAFWANLPHPVATEMSFGFRFTAERLYQMGFINRLVEPDQLLPEAFSMADHLLSLPPASTSPSGGPSSSGWSGGVGGCGRAATGGGAEALATVVETGPSAFISKTWTLPSGEVNVIL